MMYFSRFLIFISFFLSAILWAQDGKMPGQKKANDPDINAAKAVLGPGHHSSAPQPEKGSKWSVLRGIEFDKKGKVKTIKPDLKKILGTSITIKGFMLPMDFSQKEITEFLLMPYIPSCFHIPPPPPSQIIMVKVAKGKKVAPSYYPVEVTGKIKVEQNKEMESSYLMDAVKIKEVKSE